MNLRTSFFEGTVLYRIGRSPSTITNSDFGQSRIEIVELFLTVSFPIFCFEDEGRGERGLTSTLSCSRSLQLLSPYLQVLPFHSRGPYR